MSEISKRAVAKRNLAPYLLELKTLLGGEINPSDLTPIEDLERIRDQSSYLSDEKKASFSIEFDDKLGEKFRKYISNLKKANNSEVYVWTGKSNLCGLCRIDSIEDFDISFPFDVNSDEMILFLTVDCCDRLLFDFFIDSDDQKILEVESEGKNWPFVRY
jgi:hypothetical protein